MGRLWPFLTSPPSPSPYPSGLVLGIDVSSRQPADLTALIAETSTQLAIVRMYLPWEEPDPAISILQVQSAREIGCFVLPYCWLYASADPVQTVTQALALARIAGCPTPVLFADVEAYTDGTIPNSAQVQAFIDTCVTNGVQPGIYSSRSMWSLVENAPDLTGVWIWVADYNGIPSLDVAPFGVGLPIVVGHQYSGSSPVDLDVFDFDGVV